MQELKDIKSAVKPTDTLLVVDAMTGQEAANLVKTFNDEVDITGVCRAGEVAAHTLLAVMHAPPSPGPVISSGAILTKMDGDSRGGAALSVREVSGGGWGGAGQS